MNFLLTLQYDGTGFSGWQKQPGARTVQEELEKAAHRLFRAKVSATAAGRTDKGVHALAQAVSLKTGRVREPKDIRFALNALLPEDIAVTRVKRVPESFNPRYAARGKIYQYVVWNEIYRTVWSSRYRWHIRERLDCDAMREAARCLAGRHNFSAFDAAGGTQDNKNARLEPIRIARRQGNVIFTFQGDRFLYKMVRAMVGTLAEVGLRRRTADNISAVLKGKKRTRAGRTAPAKGLFLKQVLF